MKILAVLVSLLLSVITSNAQLIVNSGTMTPTQYVQNVLVGSGVTVSNVTFSGNIAQLGDFNSANANVGIPQGLILSTGSVTSAIGPNDDDGFNYQGYNGPNDADLQSLSGIAMKDAAILEFDFIPSGDSIRFNYVFSSEEYPEYAPPNGSAYNDAFGFFLSGPGITGSYSNNSINLAKLPGTNTAVSINNVNPVTNSSFYVNNGTGYNAPYNSNPQYIQYNGLTVKLTAEAQVQCNQSYHIKIAIADGFDDQFNSGVFLEGGSFNSEIVQIDINTPTLDVLNNMSAVIEGCSNAIINFTRPDTVGDMTIHFTIGGDALNGIDYNQITDSVTFVSGYDTTSLTIIPIIDGPDDYGQDTVIITYTTTNPCGDTIVSMGSFLIIDVPNLIVETTDTTLCPIGGNITLSANAYGAVEPFIYEWTNTQGTVLGNGTSISVSGNQTDTFYVSVTDSCNLITVFDTVNVTIYSPVVDIDTQNDTTIYCVGQTVQLTAFPVDGFSMYNYSWTPGGSGSTINVSPNVTTTYHVTATEVCAGNYDVDSVTVTIIYTPMNIVSTTSDTILECQGNSYNLEFYADVENGTSPYSFYWSDGINASTDSLFQTSINSGGTYAFVVTDACSNDIMGNVNVSFLPYTPMSVLTPMLDTICSGNEVNLTAIVSDGMAPYEVLWEDGQTGSSIIYTTSGNILIELDLVVTDKCGQSITTVAEIPVKVCEVIPANVFTPNGDNMNETLTFSNLEFFKDNNIVVFNRWGKKVFEQDNYQNDWGGDKLSEGTYFYILTINDSKNSILKGSFTIFN